MGPYRSVNLIASREEPRNLCIDHILSKHRDKTIQFSTNRTVSQDFCALTQASNLAVTISSFSTTAKMMNTVLVRLFYVPLTRKVRTFSCKGKAKRLHVEGYDLKEDEMCTA